MNRSVLALFVFLTMARVAVAQPGAGLLLGGEKDPLKSAKEAMKSVTSNEERVLQSLQAIEQLTRQHRFDDWKNEKLILEEFRTRLIPSLRQAAAELLTKKADFDKNFKLYQSAVEKAPAAFDEAARQFQAFAEQEEEMTFKEYYLDMEIHARNWSQEMVARHERLAELYDEVTEKTAFVEKSVVFLDRLDGFLAIYPDPDKAEAIQTYLEKLNGYIDQFRRAIDSFQDFSNSLKDPTKQSPGLRPSPSGPPISQVPSQRTVTTIATYRLPSAAADAVEPAPQPRADRGAGYVSAVERGTPWNGRMFEITFPHNVSFRVGGYVDLTSAAGGTVRAKVAACRGRQVVVISEALLPETGDEFNVAARQSAY